MAINLKFRINFIFRKENLKMPNGSQTSKRRPELRFDGAIINGEAVPSTSEPVQHGVDSLPLSTLFEETQQQQQQQSQSRRQVKAVRMSVNSIKVLLEESDSFSTLPIWSKINRIIFQCIGVSEKGNVSMSPSGSVTILQSPQTYLPILRELKQRYGIQLYAGIPVIYSSITFHSGHRQSLHELLVSDRFKFWQELTQLLYQHGFDGVELNFEGFEYVSPLILENLSDFMYRGSTMISFKNKPVFIHHHHELLRDISELIEAIIINAYGYFKFIPNSDTMLPKSESSVEDWMDSYEAYREAGVSASRLMMSIETSAIVYYLNADNFGQVDCMSFIPLRVVDNLSSDPETANDNYVEYLDRSKQGCVLECRERGVVISYDNLRLKILKLQICRNKQLRGCILGNPANDLPIAHEENLINLMNTYI